MTNDGTFTNATLSTRSSPFDELRASEEGSLILSLSKDEPRRARARIVPAGES